MATLNTVFKQVFGDELRDKGFVKIKGRQPYLVRVVTKEIIQLVTVRSHWCANLHNKSFEILGGMATVYRETIDLTKSPSYNINWLTCLPTFYQCVDFAGFDNDYRIKLMSFEYEKDDDTSLILAMKSALKETAKVMLPVLDKVSCLENCMDYFDLINSRCFDWKEYDETIEWFDDYDYSEFLLDIQTNNHDDLIDKFDEKYQDEIKINAAGRDFRACSSLQDAREKLEAYRKRILQKRDFVYNHPEVYKKVMQELKKRKDRNTEVLKSYGLTL